MNMREKIIEEALELFSSKGYEKTTVSNIVSASGSSRGGFYHHFQSKEEVLSAITDNYLNRFSDRLKGVVAKHTGSQLELFIKLFETIIDFKIVEISDWSELHKLYSFKGNLPIILQISRSFEMNVSELYESIISVGVTNKEFQCEYPKQVAGLWTREFMILISQVQKAHTSKTGFEEALSSQIEFNQKLVSGMLGVETTDLNLSKKLKEYFDVMEGLK